jgi:hypothetical protein
MLEVHSIRSFGRSVRGLQAKIGETPLKTGIHGKSDAHRRANVLRELPGAFGRTAPLKCDCYKAAKLWNSFAKADLLPLPCTSLAL